MDRSFLLFSVVIAAAAVLCSSESLASTYSVSPLIRQVIDDGESNNLPLQAEHHFLLFKRKFGKSYATEEEHNRRFRIFKANMRRALRHQSFDPSAIHGVTQFSDLTVSEFQKTFLGLRGHRLKLPLDANQAPILPTENLPGDFDWRERGAVTPVKNQVSCYFFTSFSLFNRDLSSSRCDLSLVCSFSLIFVGKQIFICGRLKDDC